MKLEVLNDIDEETWGYYVTYLNGSCLHSYKWSKYSSENNSAKPLYFVLKDDNNQVVAVSFGLYVEKKIGIKINSSLSFGSLAAANSIEQVRGMALAIKKYCIDQKIVTLSMNSFGTPFGSEILSEMGFTTSKRWEFILDINMPEDALWKKLHSKKRNLIRKAEKSNIKICASEDIEQYRQLNIETYNRKIEQGISFPEPAPEKYLKFLKRKVMDEGIGKLYLAYDNEKVIAGAFLIECHNNAYYMLSSASNEGLKLSAPDLILWTAITDYQKQGYRTFNFGGLSESELNGQPLEKSGLYHFKKRFSPDIAPCYKGRIILRPRQNQFYNSVKKVKDMIRK